MAARRFQPPRSAPRPGGVVVLDSADLERDDGGFVDVYAALRPYAWAQTVILRAGRAALDDDPDEVLVGEVVLDGAAGARRLD